MNSSLKVLNGADKIEDLVLNKYTAISHCLYCFVGLPLNIFITCTVLGSDKLRCKPRNSLLLGMLAGNLLSFVTASVELVYFLSPNEDVCKILHSIVGLSYIVFFLNLFLSLLDRYAAVTQPLWHREKVTVHFVVLWQIGLSLSLCLAVKWVFIFQLQPIDCYINLPHFKIVGITLLILFACCIFMRIVLHFKTKQLLNQRKRQLLADPPRLNGVINIEMSQLITSAAAVSNQEEGHQHQQPPRVHTTIETIDKLEKEATRYS